MFGDVIVPVDGSDESARALGPASALARYLDCTMHVVAYHGPGVDDVALRRAVHEQLRAIGDVHRTCTIEPAEGPVADRILRRVADTPAALVVMASHGKGRSAALVGSVTNDVLQGLTGPVLLVGPLCEPARFRLHGPMLVPTDSTEHGDAIVPIVEAFSIVFDFDPEIITVHTPDAAAAASKVRTRTGAPLSDLPPESAAVRNTAAKVAAVVGDDVDYEVLHDRDPAKAIAERARQTHAALIAMATHADAGVALLTHGSVTAATVAQAPCPVLAYRPLGVPHR